MNLEILLPFKVFTEKKEVLRIVAGTEEGYFGILPRRLDCVAAIRPGILFFETQGEGERFVAVDEGILVKAGVDVFVSVRNAIAGEDLGKLRESVEREFLNLEEEEKRVRAVLAKLEAGFVRRFRALQHE